MFEESLLGSVLLFLARAVEPDEQTLEELEEHREKYYNVPPLQPFHVPPMVLREPHKLQVKYKYFSGTDLRPTVFV